MNQYKEFFEVNRSLWNKKTSINRDSAFYDLTAFKAGKNSLHSTEMEEVGEVKGKSMLHLMCHFGMDSLSWARLGAKVTGVDFSETSIDLAKSLSKELDIPANFLCANITDLTDQLDEQFDIVFLSYGVLCWLPDLKILTDVAHHFLKPGGTFYLIDFHPALWMFDDDVKEITYSYFATGEPIKEEAVGTYAAKDSDFTHLEYYWTHDLGEMVNALIQQGFRLEHLNEFPFASNPAFNGSIQGPDGKWRIPPHEGKLPLMFSVKAQKE